MASGDTRTQQYLGIAANGNRADLPSETCCETRTQTLTREVAERVIGLDEEVQELKNNPDVVDIVATYQDLEDYDTSTLTDKDIIRVLQDSTHSGNSTYYRWNSTTEEFDFVGEISGGSNPGEPRILTEDDYNWNSTTRTNTAPYDSVALWLLPAGMYQVPSMTFRAWVYDTGSSLAIGSGPCTVIIGRNGYYARRVDVLVVDSSPTTQATGGQGLGYYMIQYNGSDERVTSYTRYNGAPVEVVQTAGTDTTTVMSQNATTSMIFADPNGKTQVRIGSINAAGPNSVRVGYSGSASGNASVSIGSSAGAAGASSVAVGVNATVSQGYSVGLGSNAVTTRQGEVNIGTGSTATGYNSTSYRVLGGVHDPVDAHDAATKGYVDANTSVATFYMSVTPYADRSGVSLYSDIALTTAVPASTFVQALRNCKSVFLVYKSGDLDWDSRYIAQIIGSYMPNADTAEAYDEVFPAGYYFDGNTGYRYMIQSETSDPDDTASFKIARLT